MSKLVKNKRVKRLESKGYKIKVCPTGKVIASSPYRTFIGNSITSLHKRIVGY